MTRLQPKPWRPIASDPPPKDGTLIELTWFMAGTPQEIFAMQWSHIQRNGFFPGVIGMWVTSDGSITWNESDPAGAPTHWRYIDLLG